MMQKTMEQIIFRLILLLNLIPILSAYPSALTKGIGLTPEMLTWKKFEFVNGGALIELPAKPHLHNGIYAKFFFTKKGGWPAGDYPISDLSVERVKVPIEFANDETVVYQRIEKIASDGHSIYIRRLINKGGEGIFMSSLTVLDEKYYPSPDMVEKRMKYDDEIFDRAVESIQLKGADGKYYKPKIIRLPEEIKDFTKKVKKKPVFKTSQRKK